MFKDAIYRTALRKANLGDDDDGRTFHIGFDIEVPVRDYAHIDPNLGELVAAGWDTENFRQTQWSVDSLPCRLTFAPTKGDLDNDKLNTVLDDVKFQKRIIVARKRDPNGDGCRIVLQLNADIPASERNVLFAQNYFGPGGAWCRFVQSQTKMQLDKKKHKEQEALDFDGKSEPEPPPKPTKPAKLSKLDEGLIAALYSMQDAEKRWGKRLSTGLSNADLKAAIGYEFGISGGNSAPGKASVAYAGGTNPRFWYGKSTPTGSPTLKGKALVDKVRQLLKIPLPTKPKKEASRPSNVPASDIDQAIGRAILQACPREWETGEIEADMLVDIESRVFVRDQAGAPNDTTLKELLIDNGKRCPNIEFDDLQVSFNNDGCQVFALEDGFPTGDSLRELSWVELVTFIKDNPTIGLEKGDASCQKKQETATA